MSNSFPNLSPLQQALLAIEEMQARLTAVERARSEPIAIIGMGCRYPRSNNPAEFWRLMEQGEDAVTEVPNSRWNASEYYDPDPDATGRISTRWGGFLDHVDQFDAEFFGISPREAHAMDPQQRLVLEVAWEALEDAGLGPVALARQKTGVFLGMTSSEYAERFHRNHDLAQFNAYYASGIARSVAAGRISYVLGLQGPNLSVDTACSSSLVALHIACLSLRAEECRTALAGGVNVVLSPETTMSFSRSHMLANDGRCKAFDARADGFVRAEGCGIVVLKRWSDAVADGDQILAVIRGSAINQDGRSGGLTVPSGSAQQAVIREALAAAQVEPCDVSYVESHGTETSLGDPIEAHALAGVFGQGRTAANPLVIGSVKANIGHAEAAAGIAGVIKAVLCLRHGHIPPQLHFVSLNPHIDWGGVPVEIPVQGRPWPRGRRLAGVSSFGFSGTNAHVILEAAPEQGPRVAAVDRPLHVLALSARNEAGLRAAAGRYTAHLESTQDPLADICYTANAGRMHFEHRLLVSAGSVEELRGKLGEALPGRRVVEREGVRPVFLFTGQGAQYPGMGRELFETQPVFRAALEECDRLLRPWLEQPLLDVLCGAAHGRLNETAFTQPALFALEYSLAQLWQSWGIQPSAVLGHSVGEYAAACVAGVYSLAEGVKLIAERGRRMQALGGRGGMTAVMAPEAVVREALEGLEPWLAVAAVNAPESVVISGWQGQLEEAERRLEQRGVRVQPLTVSHAFHSAQMDPMVESFAERATAIGFQTPRVALISSVTGEPVTAAELSTPDYWRRQVRQGVQFRAAMETLERQGRQVYLEIGPGTTLLGLGGQCVGTEGRVWLASLRRGQPEWRQMLESLGQLYVRGAEVDWAGFDAPYDRRRVSLPTYPFQRQRYWIEAAPAAPARHGEGHPLLGRRFEVAGTPASIGWQTEISLEKLPYLADHSVQGTVILPMTAYLEMLTAAAAELQAATPYEITIGEPLRLAPGESKTVQVLGREGAMEIYSRAAGEWRLHATGRPAMPAAAPETDSPSSLRGGAKASEPHVTGRPATSTGTPEAEGLSSLRQRLSRELPIAEFYAWLRARGVEFGPAFLNVNRLWTAPHEALALVSATGTVAGEAASYHAHPALLDACVQAVAGAMDRTDPGLYLPVGVEQVDLPHPLAGELWSHARLRTEPGPASGMLVADVRIFSSDGQLLGSISGLRLRQARTAVADDCLFVPEWQLRPAVRGRELGEILAGVAVPPAPVRDSLQRMLDELCSAYILESLRGMGWTLTAGYPFSTAAVMAECGIAERHQELLARSLEILAEDGILRCTSANHWQVPRSADVPDPAVLAEALRRQFPEADCELTLLERCGRELAAVLRGRTDPLQLLFPGGSLGDAARLYTESPSAIVVNAMLRDAVAGLVAGLSTVRVLEIGAGTGGATQAIAPALPPDRTEYVYTDISPLFPARAKETFAAYPFFQYRTLDIERDPESQGFAAGAYDIVLAANVLHATADLRTTLGHARQLLAPGGMLVLVEITRAERWIDLTFGMTEGWWRFRDRDLRPSYPLLTQERWCEVLDANGFEQAAALQAPSCTSTILMARRPLPNSACQGSWLIVADSQGIGAALARRLEQAGGNCTVIAEAPHAASLLDADRPWRGIVHLASLDAPAPDKLDVERLRASEAALCGGILELAQRLALRPAGSCPRLWLVTRGAQHVTPAQACVQVAQAPVWGLARSLAREYPESGCVAIDLDPDRGVEEAGLLFDEIRSLAEENQVAFRGGSRFVFQLTPFASATDAAGPLRLSIPSRGVLDHLRLEPACRRQPGPGQVEIAVECAGLVFRDVLNVLDLYPGDPGPLGGECGGRIAALGAGVHGFSVGDQVVAMAPGAHDGFVLADARLVVPKPAGCTLEASLTLLSSFLTATHALEELANLRRADRVLIHSAAGGVGLAAVQVAQRVGAEIFATAGSEEKRAYLRFLGIPHVFDSRTQDFAGQILEQTGGRGVDVVLNSLANEFVAAGFSALAEGGRFIEIGKRGIWTEEQVRQSGKNVSYHVVDLGAVARQDPECVGAMLQRIFEAAGRGVWTPLPYRVFAFRDALEAYRFMAQARHIGKIILRQESSRICVLPGSSYLVAGGLGGLGLEVARWLVEKGARQLVLTGRSEPSATARAAIAGFEAAGARVMVRRADISKREEMAAVFNEIDRTLPPLRGVVHAAGTLDDGVMAQQTWERFERVMDPKVAGVWILHQLTAARPLDFFVLFSSIASVLGASGQANHAAANAFEDALAHLRRIDGLPALSVNWGAWSEVGTAVREDLARRRALLGIGSFTTREGLALLERALSLGHPQVCAARFQPSQFARQFANGRMPRSENPQPAAASGSSPKSSQLLERLETAPETGRLPILREYVETLANRILGFAAGRGIDPRQPLHELGLDSLMAVEFRNALAGAVKRPLPATLLFSCPALEDISVYLSAELFGAPATTAPAKAAGVLEHIEDLSDEDVDRLLADRIGGVR